MIATKQDKHKSELIKKSSRKLIELKRVYIVFAIFVAIELIIICSIGFNCSGGDCTPPFYQSFEWSSFAWLKVIELFSPAIDLFAALIAVLGFIALNHRSEQTQAQMLLTVMQIDSTKEQNLFSNYYKHLE